MIHPPCFQRFKPPRVGRLFYVALFAMLLYVFPAARKEQTFQRTRLGTPCIVVWGKGASALQAPGLAVHILDHDVVDFAQGGAVFQRFPGLVGVEMDLDQFVVAHHQQAVAL